MVEESQRLTRDEVLTRIWWLTHAVETQSGNSWALDEIRNLVKEDAGVDPTEFARRRIDQIVYWLSGSHLRPRLKGNVIYFDGAGAGVEARLLVGDPDNCDWDDLMDGCELVVHSHRGWSETARVKRAKKAKHLILTQLSRVGISRAEPPKDWRDV
jgi:hypothetical protein